MSFIEFKNMVAKTKRQIEREDFAKWADMQGNLDQPRFRVKQ